MSKFKIYLKSILIPLILGAVVGLVISGSMDYETLKKPFLAPPGSVFPIVWTILYILMGISYGILKVNSQTDKDIDSIYYGQLVVNLLWPIAFFVFKWRLFSLLWIILLAVLIIVMIINFYRKHKTAGLLQVPYLIWTIFATYLNLGFYILNK